MRKINKKIILLSFILATIFLNSSNIYASNNSTSTLRRGNMAKNQNSMQESKDAIENALKNNNYNLFINTLKKININDNITPDQFTILVNSYNLFKSGKQQEAVKLLQDNKVNPVLIKFINNRADLTDAQKNILKKASDLVKQGKIDEAKALLKANGLSEIPPALDKKINKMENKHQKEELKETLDKVRELKKDGRFDEAKKLLKDAGVPNNIQDKIAFASTNIKDKSVGFFQSIKNLFIK